MPWTSVDPRVRILVRAQLISRHAWLRIPGLLETTNTVLSGSGRRVSRYAWWILGTLRPEKLAQAIEEAMVADGHPKARGMTARAVAEEIVVPWTRGPNPLRSRKR